MRGRTLSHAFIVLDEAQNVEDAATNFLGSSMTPRGLKMVLHRIYDSRRQGALPALEQAIPKFDKLPARERVSPRSRAPSISSRSRYVRVRLRRLHQILAAFPM